MHVLLPHKMHIFLKVIWLPLNPQIHDLVFWLCTLFDPTLDLLNGNTTVVLHPTHSHVPLHIHMIISNFPQSLEAHQYWCFLPPPSLPLIHNNLEMMNSTQT